MHGQPPARAEIGPAAGYTPGMTMPMTMAPSVTPSAFWNGRSSEKGSGDTTYRGPLSQLPPPEPITDIPATAERMFSDGFIQIPDLFSSAECAEIRAWMDASGEPDAAYEFKDWCFNKHLKADFEQDPMWLKLIDRGPVPEILALILGKDYYVNWGSIWVTGKGRGMGMHIDHFDIQLPEDVLMDPRVRIPILNTTLHLYFDDQVEEIGPTLVIPGSHRAGRAPHDESTWRGIAPQMVSVRAGGAVLFRHDLWHGAAMNRSTRRRHLIQVRYIEARDAAYRQRQPSPAVRALATPRQAKLLGFAEAAVAPAA